MIGPDVLEAELEKADEAAASGLPSLRFGHERPGDDRVRDRRTAYRLRQRSESLTSLRS